MVDSPNLDALAALIGEKRDLLLMRWRDAVRQLPSAKGLDIPTLNDHVPQLLGELTDTFLSVSGQRLTQAVLEGTPPAHGIQRFRDGFDIAEVVSEYNLLRRCILDLADEDGLDLRGRPMHILNRVLDEAISLAVQTFAIQQALEVQRRREEYLAFVAHDLRTPLNAISLATRVLESVLVRREESLEIPRMLNMVKILHRNGQQIQLLTDRILKESAHVNSTSGLKLERRQLDLWPLVEALIYELRPVADTATTRIRNDVAEDQTVFADASVLKRILQNLISNAIKYTPHGEVIIAAEAGADGSVTCSVRDDGAGIPEDRIALIFDKLETDGEKEGGLGLGLAIVKMFVEAHGGEVSVHSREGAGSEFRFTLPGRAAG